MSEERRHRFKLVWEDKDGKGTGNKIAYGSSWEMVTSSHSYAITTSDGVIMTSSYTTDMIVFHGERGDIWLSTRFPFGIWER